jgi:hypothetical protein
MPGAGLQIEGVLAYFTHLKWQKCIEDDVRYVFTKNKTKFFWGENDPLVRFIQSKCLKMDLINLKVFKI